jgi:hypothetical protein
MDNTLAQTGLALFVLALCPSLAIARELEEGAVTEPAPYSVFWAHALGLWYPNGAGEIKVATDVTVVDAASSPGLSVEFSHRLGGRQFGLGIGARYSRVEFSYETVTYGGVPPWGWVHSGSQTFTLIEPFVSFEFGPSGNRARSHRMAGQVGYHSLEPGDGYLDNLSGPSVALEFGLCPKAKSASGLLMDLVFRGSAVFPQHDRDEVMFVLSIGIGINQRL